MRLTTAVAGTIALGASLLAGVAHAESPVTVAASVSKLFVQDAAGATATRIRGHRWSVTLTGVDPTTLWFADRPERMSGRQTTASFVRQWVEFGFADVPPNAVIQHSGSEGVAVELRHPRYDRKKRTLTYTAIVDPGSGKRLARSMTDVSVFIDDAVMLPSTMSIQINNVPPSSRVAIGLSAPDGSADPMSAGFGPSAPGGVGSLVNVSVPEDDVVIEQLSVTATSIELITGQGPGGFETGVVQIQLPFSTTPSLSAIGLTVLAPEGVEVLVSVNNGQTQDVSGPGRAVIELIP